MSDQHKKTKGRIELPGNNQKGLSKSAADPNTQLLKGSHNTDTETLVIIENAEDKIDIDSKEQVTEATADKIQSLTTHNSKEKIPTEASNPMTNPLNIEAQVTALENARGRYISI